MDSVSIDGLTVSVVKPATVAELCELVKQQRAKKEAVYPVGGRTMLDFGLPPTKPGVAVDVTSLNQVIDYPARDMTITMQAGITFAKLREVLAKENQWLPLDVPDPERMTIGGLIACNVSGPRRYGYGTLRDYLIGIEFVSDDGVVIHGGGRVVKNVAGYDLMKLQIGALGTLGVITQVTLKVRPKPEVSRVILFDVSGEQFGSILEIIRQSTSRPVAFGADGLGNWMFALGFEEKQKTLEWQMNTINGALSKYDFQIMKVIEDEFWQEWISKRTAYYLQHLAKISTHPSQIESCIKQLRPAEYFTEPLSGTFYAGDIKPLDLAAIKNAVVLRAPTNWKTPERVFGKPTSAFELMRHIKHTLDPENVFNPGRMF